MKSIGALFGVGIAGLFVGAVAVELIRRTNPNFFKEIGSSTGRAFRVIGSAFKEGYYGDKSGAPKLRATD